MRKILAVVLFVLALPVFLIIYNPPMQLGGLGIMLGFFGLTLSPLIVLGMLVYAAMKIWKGPGTTGTV